jgi:2-polyprenyl-3-methyl-5-hydroxy-6-metoxy-1,4-benzoquinol methylase
MPDFPEKDPLQQRQEDEYVFPYHYIAHFRGGFSQCLNDAWGINYAATIEFLLHTLSGHPFDSLIDIGCGDGRMTTEISNNYPNKTVAGVDLSERAVRLARAMSPQCVFHCRNIATQQMSQRFDLALLIEVLEHIPPVQERSFMRAVANLLNPGGILLVTVPHANISVGYKHYRHFTIQTLSECLAERFTVMETIPLEKIGLMKKIIDSILTNRFFILNHRQCRDMIYPYYKVHRFRVASEKDCGRVFIKAQVRSSGPMGDQAR